MAEITLLDGRTALVDESDLPAINGYRWYASETAPGHVYVTAWSTSGQDKNGLIFLHRLILGAKKGQLVDHKDGNGLDNRRTNIRIATRAQNLANSRKQSGTSSRYKGVCWRNSTKRWRSAITINGKYFDLGLYRDERAAALAYDIKAREAYGDFARLNFPDPHELAA